MYVGIVDSVPEEEVKMEGARGARVKWLIPKEVAETFVMRMFIIARGGSIPEHTHDWEHEIYVLRGRGRIKVGDEEAELSSGMFAYIPPGVPHSYENTGSGEWVFLCIIPKKGAQR